MSILRKLAVFAALMVCLTAQAQRVYGYTNTYSGLTWAFSTANTPGLTSCSDLVLDATGDFADGSSYAMHGQLYCPSLGGSYASSGVAYFDSSGGFHMTVSLSVSYQMVCDNLSGQTMSGSCPVYNNLGASVGTVFISLL